MPAITMSGPRAHGETIFLIGFMGVGKTTVGRLLAARLGREFIDLDARIEAQVGQKVHEIFAGSGEDGFRRIEAAALLQAASLGAVVAAGGGAPTWGDNLAIMRAAGVVVLLTADAEVLLHRLEQGEGLHHRPLLSKVERGLLPEHIANLYARRAAAYAQADLLIDTGGQDPQQVTEKIVSALAGKLPVHDIEVVGVGAGGADDYRVVLDAGGGAAADRLSAALLDAVPGLRAGAKLAVLTDDNVAALHLPRVRAALSAAGLSPQVVVMPPGEQHKTLLQVERLATQLLAAGLDRGGVLLSLGGGVVSDVGGFLAAIFLRGIPWAAAPTTLLSQADAAIGGKTGVNLPQGKNLLGAFHSPALVYADLSTLRTLPRREVASGLGEIVKHALLCDEATLALLEENAAAVAAGDPALLKVLLSASCRLKAGVVAADPHERDLTRGGGRAVLNLGHTVGHALETASHGGADPLRHGEAVALGLLATARVSARLGLLPASFEGRLRSLLGRLGLPTDLDRRLSQSAPTMLETTLDNDKKRAGGRLRYVALRGVGRAEIVPLSPAELAGLLQRNHQTAFSAEE